MLTTEQRIVRTQSQIDRMWMDVEGVFGDVHRVAFSNEWGIHGQDANLARAVLVLVLSEITARQAARIDEADG